ncbi:Aste57867_12205 [Aphanomyces stellatus]|uniref:Aste57867_12205 protein n=1 Tax=Aphanomyces stellatus TaxID=120398 RepID=A0A485KVE6_9STRA|nr:hypothetical protein As57867_012160 [Aphanomyces stellatus]VFT89059.1 Aste57867_12205 [Aphanomyces stellatus]
MNSFLTAYPKNADGTISQKSTSGFSWAAKDPRVFNWHPVLMTFGLILCSSQAILIFETKPFAHHTNKLIHIVCHSLSIVSVLVGTIAVFRFHNDQGIPNLYSLHSWVGISTLLVFGSQYIIGFLVYFYPGVQLKLRMSWMPYHVGAGVGIMALVGLTVVSGILEKLTFNGSCNINGVLDGFAVTGLMALDCIVGNTTGLLVFLWTVSFIVAIWLSKHPLSESATRNSDHDSASDEEDPLLKNA